MNTTPTTTKGEQAKSQLIAAALAQFGEYGLHATTRDIAAQAGQNIAAITYYFGSKEDLYLACAQWIADFIGTSFRPHVEEATALFSQPEPDRAAIRQLILNACHNMIRLLTHDDTLNLSKFISREQLSPTTAYQLVHDQVIAPMHQPSDPADRRLYRTGRQRYRHHFAYPRPAGRSARLPSGA